jgi:NADPH:quinone reductase-like Zn-dependent oxidoreductase
VRFDHYGGPEVLEVREVQRPAPGEGEILVAVKAAGINPGEIGVREGRFHEMWPAEFPSGQGSDLAGVVAEVGPGVDAFAEGDEVCGWTDRRASQAEYVAIPATHAVIKPAGVPWEVAGALFVAPFAAYACVKAVAPVAGENIVVSAAAGGVGSVAVQLARLTGATVIGLASEPNHAWLRSRDVVPVPYGEGQVERILWAADGKVDGLIDTFGGGYVDLAIDELGVPRERINTIADFEAIGRLGVHGEGTSSVASADVMRQIADHVAAGRVEVPIARTYPLAKVREAYEELAKRKTHGKIVLLP